MKKALALILAFLYAGSSTGATFHMHYCMGKLVEVALWHGEVKPCNQCSTGHSKSCAKKCCRDEHKTVKLEKDQKTAEHAFHFNQVAMLVAPLSFFEHHPVHVLSIAEEYPVTHAPPRSNKIPTHIFNCSFLI